MGDFNIRLDKPDSLSLEFIDLMEVQGFNQLVKNSTHNAGGCLDLIFAPFWFPIDNINVLDTKALADHYPITFDIKLTTAKLPSHFEISHRNWDKINSNSLKNSIHEVTDKILDQNIHSFIVFFGDSSAREEKDMTTTNISSILQLIPLFKTKLNTGGLQNIHIKF